jgi:hypothetical protein
LYSTALTPRKTPPSRIVATRNRIVRFLRPSDDAHTASAIVSDDMMRTAVLNAPSLMSSRFDAPSKSCR